MRSGKRRRVDIVRVFALLSVLAALSATGFVFGVGRPGGQEREYEAPQLMAVLQDKRIRESSGICASPSRPGVYFTLNDSGDSARIFSFNESGVVLRENRIANAKNIDWEDMASATLDGKPYLFIGDIGDNSASRSFITLYRIVEPTGRTCVVDQHYSLSYPGEAQNAETLLVHPKTGDITIVTKSQTHAASVYFLPRPRKSGSYMLRKLGKLEFDSKFGAGKLITGGAWSHDARHVVLRTYLGAYEFPADDPDRWFKEKPAPVATYTELQGEAITYSAGDDALITTSEGNPCPVSIIRVRTSGGG